MRLCITSHAQIPTTNPPMKKLGIQHTLAMLMVVAHICGAATLKQIQTYPEQDKLDVLLLLDSAFSGEVGTASVPNGKSTQKMTMISQITSGSKVTRSFQNSPIKKLEIIPKNNNLYFSVESRKPYYVKPSISKDKNTLRLSFFTADSGIVDSLLNTPTTLKPTPINEVFQKPSSTQSTPQDKDTANAKALESPLESTSAPLLDTSKLSLSTQDMDIQKYWYIIASFLLILVVLLYIRKQIRRRSGLNDSLKVVSQSQIDPKNKVIIIEAKEYFYMVLLGDKGNVLLDKIPKQTHTTSNSPQAKPQRIGDVKAFDEKFWSTLNNAK